MTATDVAADMGIHLDDLNDYVFGLVPVRLDGGGQGRPSREDRRPDLRLVHG